MHTGTQKSKNINKHVVLTWFTDWFWRWTKFKIYWNRIIIFHHTTLSTKTFPFLPVLIIILSLMLKKQCFRYFFITVTTVIQPLSWWCLDNLAWIFTSTSSGSHDRILAPPRPRLIPTSILPMCEEKMARFYGATHRASATPQGQRSERRIRGSRISESHLWHYEPGMHLEDISRTHQTGHSPLEGDNITIPSHGSWWRIFW